MNHTQEPDRLEAIDIVIDSNFIDLKQEVNLYFEFLLNIINNNLELYDSRIEVHTPLESGITHILKANGYLILYNLLEATIENALKAAHLIICETSFNSLTTHLKKTILTEFKKMEIDLDKFPHQEIIETTLHKITLDKYKPFSGNLDAKKIKNIIEKYGIALDTTSEDKKGAKLLIVKNRRNALAHGGQSFIQIGRDTSIDELIAIKNQTILFLENFLQCTRAYLEQQHYQLEPDAQG
ncbi:hypothetical protein SAMN02745130_01044 [Thiothrix eikelboomii]|uniref:MAE-28990/MAE-18760-like HEPN domain-containing protein n=1 Tax=Thiothrix eikelboomii TaxID=92487 RepID=A0A1T4W4V5_9GAMM|nr:MAE_28990/MAE_18760 family HEPN-like nuclease [Thiothrix eikelboomii]SKA72354.1 hypothetical protein SAMN02745130_01044 [Thiothrix eikelboomii]